jgi:hypothetical protein
VNNGSEAWGLPQICFPKWQRELSGPSWTKKILNSIAKAAANGLQPAAADGRRRHSTDPQKLPRRCRDDREVLRRALQDELDATAINVMRPKPKKKGG